MEHVCPDSPMGTESHNDCYVERKDLKDAPDDTNIVTWLKASMFDMLSHELAHSCDGPFIFGYSEDCTPNFEVFRNLPNGPWLVREKKR